MDRCVKILSNVLVTIKNDEKELGVQSDFFIRSMDLISSLIAALNEKAEPVIRQSNLILVLKEFIGVNDLTMRQYLITIIGDLQKNLGACIHESLPEFVVFIQ